MSDDYNLVKHDNVALDNALGHYYSSDSGGSLSMSPNLIMLHVLQLRRRRLLQTLMMVALEVDQEAVMMVAVVEVEVEVVAAVSCFGDCLCF